MRISIQAISTDPANTMMECYTEGRALPVCKIWEEDFVELLTDRQFKAFEQGKFIFNVDETKLMDSSKQWFNRNK